MGWQYGSLVLVTKPENPSLILRTHMVEKDNSPRLDIHMDTMPCVPCPPNNLNLKKKGIVKFLATSFYNFYHSFL